jgi:DNA-binding transcriptional ArsR family regulator
MEDAGTLDRHDQEPATLAQLRAIAHPVRLRIVSLLTGVALNATEVAQRLGITQANASYHLRLLERAGLVVMVEEKRIRGGRSRRFRHLAQPLARARDGIAPEGLRSARAGVDRVLAAELIRRGRDRIDGPAVITDAELWVTPPAWEAFVDALREAALELHAAADAPDTPGALRVSATIDAFVMDPAAATGPTGGVPGPGNAMDGPR